MSSIIHALGQLGEMKDIYLAEPSSEEVVRRFYEKGTFPELPGSPHNVF
ncbi:MAG: hypothetical protein M1299_04485 [Firmicutes bacterium]|nr:hypothetical protein [Bacillota bacterium]